MGAYMSQVLLVGSKSLQRHRLLFESKIPFKIIGQNADESQCDYGLPFAQLLESIAIHKMNHILMPECAEGGHAYVLTVDTMVQDGLGNVYGKPKNKMHAIETIKALRDNPGSVGTTFCLDKKLLKEGKWVTEHRIIKFENTLYKLDIQDHWIDIYCEQYPEYLSIAGALTVETYGAQFITSLDGSYGAALGLPVFELREALEKIGFYNH